MATPPCTTHPDSAAAWRCGPCDRSLCELCAASASAGGGALAICASCGALAEPLLATRASVAPFERGIAASLAALRSPRAVALVCIVACAAEYLGSLSPPFWLLGHALEWGWFFIAVHRASWGFPPFGAPTYDELASSWLGPLLRLLVSIGPLALGAVALVHFGLAAASPASPFLWLLALAGVWLLPPALAFACVEGSGTAWVAPWQLPERARELGGDLKFVRILVSIWIALLVIKSIQIPMEDKDPIMAEKIVAAGFDHLLSTATLAALACVLGHLLRTHAEQLGHGDPASWSIPVAPQAVPRGAFAPRAAAEIALITEPVEIELEDPRQALLDALARGDEQAALARYRSGEIQPEMLDGEVHVKVAQLLAARGEDEPAALVLRSLLARAPVGSAAPRALVILARLCAERLGAAEEAVALYRRVVEKFPGTAAARFAEEKLAEPLAGAPRPAP
jgi:hypothetical protein